MPIVIDSDILIDLSRGDAFASSFIEEISKKHTLAISVITKMELLVGLPKQN